MLTMLRITHVRTKQFILVQCLFFFAEFIFCTLSLIYICATRYLYNAIQQIVLQMSYGFRLFPHFQITFSSVVLDFKLFIQNIPINMISKKKI